ncbi:uncharacterized protein V2V93DRAFT_364022 [Kockiozyma suomiensis]|uniref:uncharacterized protein n=1 Tax=Kockiozyma suomiensis TaxID=1337062 RepID=UPI0033433AC9
MAPIPGGILVTNEIKPRRAASAQISNDGSEDSRSAKKSRVSSDPYDSLRSQLDSLAKRPDRPIVIPRPPSPSSMLPPPPEIVTNVQGSSAGAGSGEFHVYKQARRREMERMQIFDQQRKKEAEQQLFDEKRRQMEALDRERTEKRREKRRKRSKNGKSADNKSQDTSTNENKQTTDETKAEEASSTALPAAALSAAAPIVDGEINLTIVDDFDF